MAARSLEGRRFRDVTPAHEGDVGDDTVFEYHEDGDGTIWARYQGGTVRLGFLVGTRIDDRLDFRYSHVTTEGETAAGHCTSWMEVLADGRLRLHESWRWESKPGSGTSMVEEVADAPVIGQLGRHGDVRSMAKPGRVWSIQELRERRAARTCSYDEVLRVEALSAGLHLLEAGATDPQAPHNEDEVYVVLAGRAGVEIEGVQEQVSAGSLVYVARGVPHRFVDIREDLELLVVFAPPESG